MPEDECTYMKHVLSWAQSFFLSLEERYGGVMVAFWLGVCVGGMAAFFWFYARIGLHEEVIFEPTAFEQDTAEGVLPMPSVLLPTPSIASTPVDDAPTPTPEDPKDHKININTATQTQLESLPGVGPVIAERIIQHRPYTSVFDIQRVPGIGKKRYEQIIDLIRVE